MKKTFIKSIYEILPVGFIVSYFFLVEKVDAEIIRQINKLTYLLFTIITVFVGFVIVKDIITKWKSKQKRIKGELDMAILDSIDNESKEVDYSKKIGECQRRIQMYTDILNINPDEYVHSIFFSFMLLLLSVLTSIFLKDTLVSQQIPIYGYTVTFTLFWLGLYYLIKHVTLFFLINEQKK